MHSFLPMLVDLCKNEVKTVNQETTWTNATSQQFTGLSMHQQQENQNPPSLPNGQLTFWTLCPFCGIRYQSCRNMLQRAQRCQSCTKTFIAYDLDAQGPAAGANCFQSASAQQKEIPHQGAKAGSQAAVGNPPGVETRRTFTGTREQQRFPKTRSTSDVGRCCKRTEKEDGNVDMGVGEEGKGRPKNQEKPEGLKSSGNIVKKRQRKLDEESSESFDNGSSTDMEEHGAHMAMQNFGFTRACYSRRCIRQKNNVTHKERLSESGSFCATEEQNKDACSEGGLLRIHRPSTSAAASDSEKENPLEENLSNGKNENETRKENGKEEDGYKMVFKAAMERGLTVTLEIPHAELLRFSHLVPAFRLTVENEGSLRGCWELGPASLMRGDSLGGFSEVGVSTHQDDENETHKENRKVDDYKMVFKAAIERGLTVTLEIPHMKLLKFSHQVPAFRLTVKERGSLRGSWELDPASLMRRGNFGGFSEAGVSTRQDDEGRHRVVDDSITKNPSSAPALPSEHQEIPETEFFNFITDKTSDKLATGQIWAFYCDNDGMPKFYGKIKKIRLAPNFKVWVKWLEACPLPEGSIEWKNEDMPVCCGIFKSGNDANEYDSTSSFSHQLKASLTGKNIYAIHPRKGEVWALYKNWDAEWTVASLSDCKYDVVEILECNSLVTKVQVLVLVDGYKTVYKAAKERQLTVTLEIPHTELLRFSHQVPAFRLRAEKKGSLRGCWELDPAALPLP